MHTAPVLSQRMCAYTRVNSTSFDGMGLQAEAALCLIFCVVQSRDRNRKREKQVKELGFPTWCQNTTFFCLEQNSNDQRQFFALHIQVNTLRNLATSPWHPHFLSLIALLSNLREVVSPCCIAGGSNALQKKLGKVKNLE